MTTMENMQAQQQQIEALVSQVQQLQEMLKERAGTSTMEKEKDPMPMTTRGSFMAVPKFSGKAENFEEWNFRIRRFLEEEPVFTGFLKTL